MAKTKSVIPPFPTDIDRRDFGNWLSGFVDGEGCFVLAWTKNPKHPSGVWSGFARFEILMRLDDKPILDQIQSFFGCGGMHVHKPVAKRPREHPAVRLLYARTPELSEIVVPHFERHPLRAKKAGDYAIWREGVRFLTGIAHRPMHRNAAGQSVTWTDHDKEQFGRLVNALKENRRFAAPPIEPPVVAPLPLPGPISNGQCRLFEP